MTGFSPTFLWSSFVMLSLLCLRFVYLTSIVTIEVVVQKEELLLGDCLRPAMALGFRAFWIWNRSYFKLIRSNTIHVQEKKTKFQSRVDPLSTCSAAGLILATVSLPITLAHYTCMYMYFHITHYTCMCFHCNVSISIISLITDNETLFQVERSEWRGFPLSWTHYLPHFWPSIRYNTIDGCPCRKIFITHCPVKPYTHFYM